MLSLNVWFRADSPPRQETDTLAFVCECLFPRLLFFFFCVFSSSVAWFMSTRVSSRAFVFVKFTFGATAMIIIARSHIHVFRRSDCGRSEATLNQKCRGSKFTIKSRHPTNRRYIQSLIPSSNSYPNKMNSFTVVSWEFCFFVLFFLYRKWINGRQKGPIENQVQRTTNDRRPLNVRLSDKKCVCEELRRVKVKEN